LLFKQLHSSDFIFVLIELIDRRKVSKIRILRSDEKAELGSADSVKVLLAFGFAV
jgi:hypothetical protein